MSVTDRYRRKKKSRVPAILGFCFAFVVLVVFVNGVRTASEFRRNNPQADAPKTERKSTSRISDLKVGDNGRINVGGGWVILCRTTAAYEDLNRLLMAKDGAGMERLAASADAFAVQDGTAIKMLRPGILRAEVSVQEGPYKGQKGFVAPEFVSR